MCGSAAYVNVFRADFLDFLGAQDTSVSCTVETSMWWPTRATAQCLHAVIRSLEAAGTGVSWKHRAATGSVR